MSYTDDAAEQLVRMSLQGAEVAVRITGSAAKEVAMMLVAAVKNKGSTLKTKGKERLNTMLKSGKALEIFSVKEADLQKFAQGAKQYGIVYCVLRHTKNSPDGLCDVMVKADDAPRISRIIERFKFGTIDKARIESEIIADKAGRAGQPEAGETPAATQGRGADPGTAAQPGKSAESQPIPPDMGDAEKLVSDLMGGREGKTKPDAPEPGRADMSGKEVLDSRPLAVDAPGRPLHPSELIFGPSANSGKDTMSKAMERALPLDFGKSAAPDNNLEEIFKRNELVFGSAEITEKGALGRQSVKDEIREIKAERAAKTREKSKSTDRAVADKRRGSPSTAHKQPQRGSSGKPNKSKGAR